MPDRPCGTYAAYCAGCRCLDCRVANAAYMVVYRAKVRADRERLGAVVNGYQTSRMMRTFKSEGYRPGAICRLLGLPRMTVWRHLRSRPVTRRVLQVVVSAWSELDAPDAGLDPKRQAIADVMIDHLGKWRALDAAAWQELKSRPSDDYYE